MSELIIKGRTSVLGKEVTIIYGGFGDNQRTMLAKTVADIHNKDLRDVNELINNHISDGYFEESIDFVDLKGTEFEVVLIDHGIITQNALNRFNNIYLLSQQGYSLLLKLMDTQPAKQQYKEVIWDYFKIIASNSKQPNSYMITDPVERAKHWIQEQEDKRALQDKVEEQKPKVLFADAVTASKTTILIRELAKLIKQNGFELGEKRLYKWLRGNGYLISRHGTDYNAPTQKSMQLELFTVKETTITHSDGYITVKKTTKVTGKGQQYFLNKFLSGVVLWKK